MRNPLTVNSTTFSRNFGRFQDRALEDGVVIVESHGRPVGAFLSPREFERYERLRRRETTHLTVGRLPAETVSALEEAESRYGETAD